MIYNKIVSFINGTEEQRKQNSYIWNTLAGICNAFQSVILLMIIMRTCTVREAGIFSFAFSNASLLLLISNFGVRSYQVTDRKHIYSFNQYVSLRLITYTLMIISSFIFVFCSYGLSFEVDRVSIIILMCFIKGIDSIEDVFYGYYQNLERLDIGSKCQCIRYIITIVFYSFFLIVFKNLLIATILTLIVSMFTMAFFIKISYSLISNKKINFDFHNQKYLIQSCFPIFISLFLLFYLNNAPKYAIDALLPQEQQAYYSFIAMPVFVISLLSNFIYQPVLTKIADYINKQDYSLFLKEVIKQIGCVLLLTVIVIIGGFLLGIPILSILYKTDLNAYKIDLMILLIGGGMYALSNFLIIVLTTIRKQNKLIGIYAIVSILVYFLSNKLVSLFSIAGAALTYTFSMTLVSICCLLLFIISYKEMRKFNDIRQNN